jgi:urease accessory protein UreE
VLDDERRVVMVVERPEAVFVIEPRGTPEWALFAYHIGNRHQPLMITDQALVCPDVPGVELLLQQHKMPYTRATLPFTPAATVAAHQH